MLRIAVLGLVALLWAMPQAAEAADSGRSPSDTRSPVLFRADEVQSDEELGLVVLRGNVEISQNDQVLLADTVTYNQRTDTVTASGHVSLLEPTGDIAYADFVELSNDMRDGFIRNLRLLLSDRSRLAGNTARRVNGTRLEIRRGVYSPCEPCAKDPSRPPEWQIKAAQVVDDRELQVVEYRDAVLELGGIPVFYTPYFSHPDPSVKRRSGLLPPVLGNSTLNGFQFRIPYYWAIDQDKDTTITPMFTSRGGDLLLDEYRERFGNGELITDGSVAFNSKKATLIDTNLKPGLRGHLFADGELDLTPDWRAALSLQRASDQTYLLRYHFNSPVNFLTTHLYGERFTANSYANISNWVFQSLRPGVGDSIEPIVAPVADYQWVSEPDVLGGRVSAEGNALNLVRIVGINTRRLSAGSEWQRQVSDPIGGQYNFSLSLRGDGYQSDNVPIGVGDAPESTLAGRVFPQIAATWQYPWVRRGKSSSQLIEPIVMVAASPRGGNPATIPNEDSQGFEFDETSLFLRNRFPGFDRVDSGQRVDYGLRAGTYGDGGGSARLLVGQSYTAEVNNNFLPGSGLDHHLSDVVGRLILSPAPWLDLIYRFRLDRADLSLRRQEVALATGPTNLRLTLNYLQIAAIPGVPQLPIRNQLGASLTAQLSRTWSLQLLESTDLSGSVPVTAAGTPISAIGTTQTLAQGAAVTYRDDCLAFIASITRSGIVNGDVRPGTSIMFTLVLKNLGDIGSSFSTF